MNVSFDDYMSVLAMLYHAIDDECGSNSTPWDYDGFKKYANKYGLNEGNFNADQIYPVC